MRGTDFLDPEMEKLTGINLMKKPREVRHSSLKRAGESEFRSICPACKKGILLVFRGDDGVLLKRDMCVLCGQIYHYTDILAMRKKDLVRGRKATTRRRHGEKKG